MSARAISRCSPRHICKDVRLPPCLGFVRQASAGIKRVEAERRLQIAMLSVQILDLAPVEFWHVVCLQHVDHSLQRPIEQVFLYS